MIWAMARLLIELDDEYLKMLEIRKSLAATGVVLAVASVWGILELYTDVPRLPVFFIFPLWCGGLVVGQLWNWKAGAVKNRLRVLRAEREWSQQDLADAARGLAPERQRDRDRQVRPLAAARVPHRRPVRPADRGDLPARLSARHADGAAGAAAWPPNPSYH